MQNQYEQQNYQQPQGYQNYPQPNMQMNASAQQPQSKKKKYVTACLLILTLLICSLLSALASGASIYYLWQDDKEKWESSGDGRGEENDNDSDNGDDNQGSGDNGGDENGDGDDDNFTATTTTTTTTTTTSSDDDNGQTTASSTQPDLDKVLDRMNELTSYKMSLSLGGETPITMNSKFQSPNKAYTKMKASGMTMEEISIGNKVYTRYTGSNWEVSSSKNLTSFHEQMFEITDDKGTVIKKKGTRDGYWLYKLIDSKDDQSAEVLVHKKTNYLYKMTVDLEDYGSGSIEFSDYNSSAIKIVAPI